MNNTTKPEKHQRMFNVTSIADAIENQITELVALGGDKVQYVQWRVWEMLPVEYGERIRKMCDDQGITLEVY